MARRPTTYVDWEFAKTTAARLVNPGPDVTEQEARQVVEDIRRSARRAVDPVAETSRLHAPGPLRRVATLSVHTSPLDQPGAGDAGGMNVYIAHLCAALARAGHRVEVFTLDTSPDAASAPSVRSHPPRKQSFVTLAGPMSWRSSPMRSVARAPARGRWCASAATPAWARRACAPNSRSAANAPACAWCACRPTP